MTNTDSKRIEEIESIMSASLVDVDGSRFSDHRFDAYMYLSFVLATVLLLFSVWHFYMASLLVGFICIVIAVLFFSNIAMMRFKQKLLFSPAVTTLAIITAALIVILKLGYLAVFWTYPVICIFFFIHSRKVASILTLLFLIVMAPLVIGLLDINVLVRFYVTLMLTGLFANMMVYVIEQQQKSLQKLAITDPLTGTLNRRCLDAALSYASERFQRNKTNEVVMMMDIDHFKKINDSYGHEVGNDVLTSVVAGVKLRLRKLDMLFRYGGDEFIILLNETNVSVAKNLAEELRKIIENSKNRENIKTTVSIGVAEIAANESTVEWVSRCDHALYQAKQNGRNQVVMAK